MTDTKCVQSEQMGKNVADDSRRKLALALVGAFGGAALLQACAADAADEPEVLRAASGELSSGSPGTAILWCDTFAEHKTLVGGAASTSTNIVVRRGYLTPADGGGGIFIWTTDTTTPQSADPLGGILVVPNGTRIGAWKRMFSGPLNVKWFGAKGDETVDDRPAIQAAIDAARAPTNVYSRSTQVFLPVGSYRIDSPIDMIDSGAAGGIGMHLLGELSGADGDLPGTRIMWYGPSTDPMIKLWNADSIIEHIAFYVAAGHTAVAGVDIDKSSIAGANVCTANRLTECRFLSTTASGADGLGVMQNGVRIGQQNFANCEFMVFERCFFGFATNAGVYIPNTTYQSKSHSFRECSFAFSLYGIKTSSGSFQTYSCNFSNCNTAIYLGAATDNIMIVDCDSEGCARFLQAGTYAVAPQWIIAIIGGRFALSGLHADGRYIHYYFCGVLSIVGAFFEGDASAAGFKINAGSSWPAATLSVENCYFPVVDPFAVDVGYCKLRALGNVAYTSWPNDGSKSVCLDDEFSLRKAAASPPPVNPLLGLCKFGQAKVGLLNGGLSGGPIPTVNLRGSIAIANTSSSATVTFAAAELSATYIVQLTVIDSTGTPAAAALRPRAGGRSVTGFTVSLEGAPGSGNSVTVGWLLVG